MNGDLEEKIKELEERIKELEAKRVHQHDIIPSAVQDRHIDIGTRAQGDILYIDGSERLARLAAGTANQVLKTGGSSANPSWGLPNDLSLTSQAQGDIIYFDGSNWVVLAAGTDGGALITGGAEANPAWSTPDTGWSITNKTVDKTLDCNVGDVNVVADVLGTLVDVLISIGIISA